MRIIYKPYRKQLEGKSGASSRGNSAPKAYIKVVAVKKLVVEVLAVLGLST